MDLNGLTGLSSYTSANTYASIHKDENKTSGFKEKLEKASEDGTDKELMDACREFESYFLQMMYKAMRKTVDTENSFIPKSNAEEMFQEMLDEKVCETTSKTDSFGLAKSLYRQMAREQNAKLQKLSNNID